MTPFVVENKLFRFEYWVELMRRRSVADLGVMAIKMRVVLVSTIPAVDDKIVVEVP